MGGKSSKLTTGGCGVTVAGPMLLTTEGTRMRRCIVRPMGGGGGASSITAHIGLGCESIGGWLLVTLCALASVFPEFESCNFSCGE